MKNTMKAGLLLLAVLAFPAGVYAYGCPLFPNVGGLGGQNIVRLGPWYLYYPYNAHFQLPAPVGPFPNWQTGAEVPVGAAGFATPGAEMPMGAAGYGAPMEMSWQPPVPQPMFQSSGFVQPAGYQQAPSYWYGSR